MKKLKKILLLFITFFKIGLFTFGGGYAMIALIEREFTERKNWLDKDEFLDIIAIAESTPGPLAINSATYVGYKAGGFWGSLFSTIGVVIPSFVIIFVISLFFDKFLSIEYVNYAFHGIQACVAFLILNAGIKMMKHLKMNVLNIVLTSMTLLCLVLFSLFAVKFSTIFYILIGAGTGLSVYLVTYSMNRKKKEEKLKEDDVEGEKEIKEEEE